MMANSYSDDIKVKISEKYKPPCRISMPMSYSQRLMLNKQLQDTRPSYDFHLEKSVLEKMTEWKDIRRDLAEEKKQRLDLARQEFNKKIEKEKAEKLEAEAKLLEETSKVNVEETKTQNVYNHTHLGYPATTNPSHHYYTKNGILMPISATNYSTNTNNILKPVPTTSASFMPPQAFNLSDFESDTSSPFDNMELKSINDLEELAQVLKSDRTAHNFPAYPNTTLYQGSGNYNSESKSYGNLPINIKSYTDYSQGNSAAYGQNRNTAVTQQQPYSQITNSYSQISSSYNPTYSQYNNPYISASTFQVPTNYTPNVNGYLYNIPPQMTSQIQLSHSNNPYDPYNMQKSNCKSVPDLVKSLEKELDSTRLSDTVESSRHSISSSYYTTTDVPVPARPKSTDMFYRKTKLKDVISDPLEKLSGDQKTICTNVSMMGFPLDRVVRVCEAIGCDQKKIVDHLLALADLLDLGFSEKDASEALMKTDNDRDKALDLLIS